MDERIIFQHKNKRKRDIMQKLNLQHISRLGFPTQLKPKQATLDDLAIHAKIRQYLSNSTIAKNIRCLKFMAKHAAPVNWQDPQKEQFINHVDYRLQIEDATANAIHNEWKALRMVLRAYGIEPWDIRLPPRKRTSKRIIPLPDMVHKIIHANYSKDPYEKRLYQYMMFHSFMEGMRNPSELAILKTSDITFDQNIAYMTITETKKHYNQRTIMLNKEIATDYRRKSLKNWLDHWRPKVANQHSKDFLFLQPSGKPFTVRHLGKNLAKHGKKIFPEYSPYVSRHFCAVAKLIETKINTGKFDVFTVKNWLGHSKIETTMSYISQAEQFYNVAPYNWFSRLLKFHKKNMGQDQAGKQKSIKGKKHLSSKKSTGESRNGLSGI